MVRLTTHAAARLRERRIDHDWVFRVLKAPDKVEPDPSGPDRQRAFGAVAEAGGKVFRVVYTERGGDTIIVTAFFDRDA